MNLNPETINSYNQSPVKENENQNEKEIQEFSENCENENP